MHRLMYPALLLALVVATPARAATLTLDEALDAAAKGNPSLRVSAIDETIAHEVVAQTKSGYLPRIDVQGGFTAQNSAQGTIINGRTIPTQQSDFPFASLGISQTLYDFGRTSSRVDRARALEEATRFRHSAGEKEVFLQVVEAYYGILEAKTDLQAAAAEVAQLREHLKDAEALHEQGVVTRNDVLQAEVKLAASEQRRLAATRQVDNGWLQLNFLTGADSGFRADLQQGQEAPLPAEEQAVAVATANRPELRALEKVVEAGSAEVREAGSAFRPELFARAGVDYVRNDHLSQQGIMSATIGMKMNLFDGLASTSKKRQAVAARSQNELKLKEMEERVALEYRTAANDARVARERIDTARKAIAQGEENLRINRDRYEEHVGTSTEVIDAQTLLTETRTEYGRALFDYEVALARIRKALGTL